jgi:hypothetical protein
MNTFTSLHNYEYICVHRATESNRVMATSHASVSINIYSIECMEDTGRSSKECVCIHILFYITVYIYTVI